MHVGVQWGCGGSVGDVLAQLGMWWLSGDVVAQLGMWWLSWRCGGSVVMWWLSGDVVAQRRCGGSVVMWWLSGNVVAQLEMWCMAQWECGGSVGVDVVAQLVKATLGKTRQRMQLRVQIRIPPQSSEWGQEL
jgi:hypothetical protein